MEKIFEKSNQLRKSNFETNDTQAMPKTMNTAIHEPIVSQQALLEALPYPVFYKDLNGAYIGCNRAFESVMEQTREQIIGKTVFDLSKDKAFTDQIQKAESRLLETAETVSYEFDTTSNSGDSVSYFVTKALYKDCDGKPAGIVTSMLDITGRRETESALRAFEKMKRELIQNQKLASIGQLAAGVAHEINNPTGFVSSNLKTLDDYQRDLKQLIGEYRNLKNIWDQVPEDQQPVAMSDQFKTIEAVEKEIDIDYICEDIGALIAESREGADRIKKIVEDLKRFAHPGQDKVQDTDINAGLESTLNIVHNELKYKARIVKDFGSLPIVSANPQQLNQVFANLLVNAAHAISQDGEIKISTADLGDAVEIRFSDNGCGIPEENLTKIFDPFFTTKDVGKGTGLGMNIVYNIIQKHHGTITVHSTVGNGTTFIIQLPIEQDRKP